MNDMLTKCPECELPVSDKALGCPHCGYPLRPDIKPKQHRRSNKRRRLPNGFGQISEIKNRNLRKPFRAMVSVGKNAKGRPICKPLQPDSYFSTYNEAYNALVDYNKNPYDLNLTMTVIKLYEKWSDAYFKTLKSNSSSRTITSAWSYCSSIYNMRAMDVRARHVKGCMDEGIAIVKGVEKKPSAGTKTRIKSMFNLMFDYALEYEIVDRNYPRTFNLSDDIVEESEAAKRTHLPFNDVELECLWGHVNDVEYVDVILIQCYGGWRPQELGLIQLDNVDLKNGLIVGGMKTVAGKDRTVPIHSKIQHLIEKRYEQAKLLNSEYLLNCTDSTTHKGNMKLTYDKYQYRFIKIRDQLGLRAEHRAHDGRNTFITMAKKNSVDEYALKYIVGHAINDVTEKVYTAREVEWLQTEIEKLK